ncbi:ABC transporter permease [Actinomadura rubrisoli]|uniref:Transport permease protein n=1 Tax=Actinomadura rubrisoli TaxID=2530368 RepID=A0A4R5BQP7_9ACTN|nr:ABC transporter permease [Actinomadura rubrisoli]TDD89271.1 ABC transporter [Actinomadura rubrisoli]
MTPLAALDDAPPRLRVELRAARMVWKREMVKFVRDRARWATSLFQPLLFLFVLGTGLAALVNSPGADYRTFLFPGVLVMAVQAPAISAGASIVWDRESGFLREMLVAPVRRGTLLTGKCLGGATVAACEGLVVLLSAGLIGVPYRLDLFVLLLGELLLTGLAMTVLGAAVAVCIRRAQTFHTVLGVLMTPMIFLSGLMFPIGALPMWLAWLSFANPLTYAVDVMRRTIAAYLPGGRPPLFEPVAWGGWTPPVLLELGLVAGFTIVVLALASRRFARPD